LGSPDALAGERSPRGELGGAFSLASNVIEWSSELSLLLREPVELSSTSWGHQLHFGTGLSMQATSHTNASMELHLSPVLGKQSARSSAPGGVLMPAELLTSLGYLVGNVTLQISAGLGLPLSTTSTLHSSGRLARAPTTPLLRNFIGLTIEN
jgi:hypothetical protein